MNALRPGVLTSNDLLLLAAAGPTPTAAQLAEWVGAPDFSWDRALESAATNRIAAAAAKLVLSEPLAASLDEPLRKRWLDLRETAQRRAETAAQELRCVGEAMARRGVAPLLYKGLDFGDLCYPTEVPRSFNDIDIIVRPKDVEGAAAALYAEGYDLPPGTPSLDYFRRFHLHAIFLDHDRRRFPVELHWALENPHAGLPNLLPHFFERATADSGFGGVLRPDPVDAFAFMAGHLDKHLGLSATLPSREARLVSVIEDHGLLWLLDIVRYMRARGAEADGAQVLARMRELAAEAACVTSLRLALDLEPAALPAWAAAEGERLPGATPLITRVVYPDLLSGGPPQERARRLRDWGFHTLPEVGFAPISALQALLPKPRVPGTAAASPLESLARLPGRLALLAANLVAVIRWRVDRWRDERRSKTGALEPGASSDPPSD